MSLSDLPVLSQVVIPPEYIDEMGHMNVMWYTHLFSKANRALTGSFGLDHDYFTRESAGTFGLQHLVTYIAEACCGQRVTIRSRLIERTAKCVHSMHFMTVDEPTQKLCATGEWIVVHVDLKLRRSAAFPTGIAEKLDQAIGAHSAISWIPNSSPQLKLRSTS